MKIRRITTIGIAGFIVDKEGNLLFDSQNCGVVYPDGVRRYLMTAKKRDTNLLTLG
jgi:hypothetical protein